METTTNKFVADVMLGRLARWLRLIGCDVYYDSTGEDSALLSRALAEDRVLLSADHTLVRRAGERGYLVISDNFRKQLAQIVAHFGIEPNLDSDICPDCNGNLRDVPKPSVRADVPEYTYLTHDRFRLCSECGKIFWQGSHRELAEKELKKILANIETSG